MATLPAVQNSGSATGNTIADINNLYNMINGVTVNDSGHTVSDTGKTTNQIQMTQNSGSTNSTTTDNAAVVQSLQNTSGTTTTQHSGRTDTSTTESNISADQLNEMLKSSLEGTQGLGAVSSGVRAGGGYGSATNTLLTNDLLARSASQILQNFRSSTTTNNIGASSDTTNTNQSTSSIQATNQHNVATQNIGPSSSMTGLSTVVGPSSVTTGPSTVTTGGIDADGILKVAGVIGAIGGVGAIIGAASGGTTGGNIGGSTGGTTQGGTGNVNVSGGSSGSTGGDTTGGTITGGTNVDSTGTITDGASSNNGDGIDHSGAGTPSVDTQGDDTNTDDTTAGNVDINAGTQGGSNVDDDGTPRFDYADGGEVTASDDSPHRHILSAYQMTLAAMGGGSGAKKELGTDTSSSAVPRKGYADGGSTGGEGGVGGTSVQEISQASNLAKNIGSLTGESGLKDVGRIGSLFASPGVQNVGDIVSRAAGGDITSKDVNDVSKSVSSFGSLIRNGNFSNIGNLMGIASSSNPGQSALNAGLNIATGGVYGMISNMVNTVSNPSSSGIINTIANLTPLGRIINGIGTLTGLGTLGSLLGSPADPGIIARAASTESAPTTPATSGKYTQTATDIAGSQDKVELASVMPQIEVKTDDTSKTEDKTPSTADTTPATTSGTPTTVTAATTSDTSSDSSDTPELGTDSNVAMSDIGTDPGGACVEVTSHLPTGVFAGSVRVGDTLQLADSTTLEESTGIVSYSEPRLQPGWRFQTENGASLICSESAPIPTQHHGLQVPAALEGKYVAVRRDSPHHSEFMWERVVSSRSIGEITVQHITVGDRCFWAGEYRDVYILHHNVKEVGSAGSFGSGMDEEDNWGFADGGLATQSDPAGLVRGPGTGISDSIPITLPIGGDVNVSNSEIILPADMPPAIKSQALRWIQQYHTPAAIQRSRGVR